MIFKWIIFGALIETGIKKYYQSNNKEAKIDFEKALQMQPKDYLVNFWLLRVNTKLGYITEANINAATCLLLKPESKNS